MFSNKLKHIEGGWRSGRAFVWSEWGGGWYHLKDKTAVQIAFEVISLPTSEGSHLWHVLMPAL